MDSQSNGNKINSDHSLTTYINNNFSILQEFLGPTTSSFSL